MLKNKIDKCQCKVSYKQRKKLDYFIDIILDFLSQNQTFLDHIVFGSVVPYLIEYVHEGSSVSCTSGVELESLGLELYNLRSMGLYSDFLKQKSMSCQFCN